MRFISLLLFVLTVTTANAQYTVGTVPNQKLIDGSYVSNPDNILDGGTVTKLDTLLKSLEKKTSVQVAVVVLESIGDADIFEFSQELFTAWGIGSKGNDNGLLLLMAKQNRTVRFHTGYGLEGALPDVICKRIEREYMVPEFKNGNYNAGILAGIQQVNKILTDPQYAEELKKPEETISDWGGLVAFLVIFIAPVLVIIFIVKSTSGRFADSKKPKYTPYPEMRLKRWSWLAEFVGIPAAIVVLFSFSDSEHAIGYCLFSLYFYYLITQIHRMWRMQNVIKRLLASQDYHEIVEFIRKDQLFWFFMGLLFPFPFFFYFFYHLLRKRIYRNHARACKQCQGEMRKLSEKDEDEYLTANMQMEESLKSVDYDVWKCKLCESVEMWHYLSRHSKYEVCPKCKTIAYYRSGNRTITSATYSASGKGEETFNCKFCGHTKVSTYTIARLVRSTSSGSSSGSSFSSSSGGGSWGGGSSGGGGASSSW